MQYVLCSIIFVLLSLGSRAQDPVAAPAREYRGTHPPDSAVIQLLEEDARLFATYRDP